MPIVQPLRLPQVVPILQPTRPPPPRLPPPTLAPVARNYESFDRLGDDMALRRRGSGIGWPSMALLAVAAAAVTAFAVVELRPDLAARASDTIRGSEGPSTSEGAPGSMVSTGSAGVTASQHAGSAPAVGGAAFGAASEPPTVSIWSLPTARAGQAPLPPAVFHPLPAQPAAPPPRGRFVPSAAYAFNFNAAPPPPSLPLILAPTPNVAAPPPAPVEEPVAKPFVMPKVPAVAPAADDAPANAAPTPVPAPKPAAPPPPPPKPKFAPGSLEDQIQKAVEAEDKKKQNH